MLSSGGVVSEETMKEIQKACGRLSQHDDMNVVVLAGKIIAADKVQDRYIADLKAEIANQAETIAALQSEEAYLRELVGKLENNLKSLQATFFGQKSEKSGYDGSDDGEVPDEGDADPFEEDEDEEKEEGTIKPEQTQKEKGNGTKRSKVKHPANIRIETKIIEPINPISATAVVHSAPSNQRSESGYATSRLNIISYKNTTQNIAARIAESSRSRKRRIGFLNKQRRTKVS